MNVCICWENSIFLHVEGSWRRAALDRLDAAADVIGSILPAGASVRLLYDPESLHTDIQEVPLNGSREVLRMALLDTHPALGNESQAWGYQNRWPDASGQGGVTQLHLEQGPGLIILREKLEQRFNISMEGAWPLVTPFLVEVPARGRASLAVVIEGSQAFVGGVQGTGNRLSHKMRSGDLSGIWQQIQDALVQGGTALGVEARLPAQVRIFTSGPVKNVATECPFWAELSSRNDVKVHAFDELGALVRRLKPGHSANLLNSLPGHLSVSKPVRGLSYLVLAAAAVFGFFGWQGWQAATQQGANMKRQVSSLSQENARLTANQTEITNLKLLYGSDVGWRSAGRAEFVKALASAVPTSATLTELLIGDAGDFRLSGTFWGGTESATKTTLVLPIIQALLRAEPATVIPVDRATYDPKSGRFAIQGNLAASK